MSDPGEKWRSVVERIKAPSSWSDLLRVIGGALVIYCVARMSAHLALSEPLTPVAIVRMTMFFVAGLLLVTGRRGHWLAIIALGIYTIAMGRYFLSHVEPGVAFVILARVALIGVLLHPGARKALDPEAEETPPPSAWIRSVTWLGVTMLVLGPIRLLLMVLFG